MAHPRWTAIKYSAARAAGVPRLYGSPADQLAVLLATYGDEQLLEAIAETPADIGGPVSFLSWLEERLELGPPDLATVTPIVEAPRGPAAPSVEVLAAIEAADREREAQLAQAGEVLVRPGRRWQDGAAAEEA